MSGDWGGGGVVGGGGGGVAVAPPGHSLHRQIKSNNYKYPVSVNGTQVIYQKRRLHFVAGDNFLKPSTSRGSESNWSANGVFIMEPRGPPSLRKSKSIVVWHVSSCFPNSNVTYYVTY